MNDEFRGYIDYDAPGAPIFACDWGNEPSYSVTYKFKYTPPDCPQDGFSAGSLDPHHSPPSLLAAVRPAFAEMVG